jgi:hypothetical protein
MFGLGHPQTTLYGPRPPPKRQRARRTARCAVPCRASGQHSAVRAGSCSAPGPRPAQTAPCAPDRTLRGPVPGSRTARRAPAGVRCRARRPGVRCFCTQRVQEWFYWVPAQLGGSAPRLDGAVDARALYPINLSLCRTERRDRIASPQTIRLSSC